LSYLDSSDELVLEALLIFRLSRVLKDILPLLDVFRVTRHCLISLQSGVIYDGLSIQYAFYSILLTKAKPHNKVVPYCNYS